MGSRNVRGDVRRLFEAAGVPGFAYSDLAEAERRDAVTGRWPLLGATNRELAARPPARGPAPERGGPRGAARFVIALVSLCGGSGRTTVAANLAHALAADGQRTLAVDLDPKNLLGLHFGIEAAERVGIARPHASVSETTGFLGRQRGNTAVLPFGNLETEELDATEARLATDPNFLRLRLEAFTPAECAFAVLDVPAGRSNWARQALSVADQVVVVLAPHPAAYATVPGTERFLAERLGEVGASKAVYLVNGFDGRSALERDLLAGLRAILRDRLLPFPVQRDEVVREALLARTAVLHAGPDSQVAADYGELAAWLRARGGGEPAVRVLHDGRVAG